MSTINRLLIQKAIPTDNLTLTMIAHAAKKHWNYPDHYYEIWKEELTITEDYIRKHIVYNAIYNQEIVGFYSIVFNPKDFYSGEVFVKKGYWLEHIFILPEHHKKGIGSVLVRHAKEQSKLIGAKKLLIFVDPFAEGFYNKIGALFIQHSKSSIPGRKLPVYALKTTE